MTKVIGLVGRARGGKSTTAASMKSESLKKGLQAEIFEMSGYVLADLNTGSKHSLPNSIWTRENIDPEMLVERGMSRRQEDPLYWVSLLESDIKERNPDIAIIPNIRFLNEARFVRGFEGGNLIRVLSLLRDGVEYISPDRDPNHQSETEHLEIKTNFTLVNMRGKEKLLDLQARTLLNYILEEV